MAGEEGNWAGWEDMKPRHLCKILFNGWSKFTGAMTILSYNYNVPFYNFWRNAQIGKNSSLTSHDSRGFQLLE